MEDTFTDQEFVPYPAFCFVAGSICTGGGFAVNSTLPDSMGGYAPEALLLLLPGVGIQVMSSMSVSLTVQSRLLMYAIAGLGSSVLLAPLGSGTTYEPLIHGTFGGALLTVLLLLMIFLPSVFERWYLGDESPEKRILGEE
jgi:hypothetical protein